MADMNDQIGDASPEGRGYSGGFVAKVGDCYYIINSSGNKEGPCFRNRAQAETRLGYGNDNPDQGNSRGRGQAGLPGGEPNPGDPLGGTFGGGGGNPGSGHPGGPSGGIPGSFES